MKKRLVRLTEGDLKRIVKRSVGRVLRESDFNDIDAEGLYNSLKTYNDNPVNINRDVDYDPSDEEIMNAMNDIDLDTDFSDLMSGQYDESRRKMGRIIRESINKVINEATDWKDVYKTPDGKKIQYSRPYEGSRRRNFRTVDDPDKNKHFGGVNRDADGWEDAYSDKDGNVISQSRRNPKTGKKEYRIPPKKK